jgi:hypothetical protein
MNEMEKKLKVLPEVTVRQFMENFWEKHKFTGMNGEDYIDAPDFLTLIGHLEHKFRSESERSVR